MITISGFWDTATRQQETIDLDCVGYPSIGDTLVLDPGCELATITPGLWTKVSSEGIFSHLVTEPMTSIVLTCPQDSHRHGPARIIRVMPS